MCNLNENSQYSAIILPDSSYFVPVSARKNSGYPPDRAPEKTAASADAASVSAASPDQAKTAQPDEKQDPAIGQIVTPAEPAYPIFFPTYTPVDTGYRRDWWWYDPSLSPEDVGSFASRAEAVADWAFTHFEAQMQSDLKALDIALGSPLLAAPEPDPAYLVQQLDALDVAAFEPKTESGRALLALNLAERVLQKHLDEGFAAVAVLSQASAENRGLLGDLLTGERRMGGLVLGGQA